MQKINSFFTKSNTGEQGRTGQYVIYQENLEGGAASWGHRLLGALQLKI